VAIFQLYEEQHQRKEPESLLHDRKFDINEPEKVLWPQNWLLGGTPVQNIV